MNKKRILSIIIISVVAILLLTACDVSNTHMVTGGARIVSESDLREVSALTMYLTFEDAAQMATDVVVAEFVEKRPFGQDATEFEFIVHERIFGNAADTIFVYTMNALRLSVAETGHSYMDDERQFTPGNQYLLLLEKIADLYTSFHDDGFVFLTDIMLDINNPSAGTMYNEPLSQHSTGLNFNGRNLSSATIISYVSAVTQNNTPARDFIRSDKLEDIIEGSPYVLIVEITEPWRTASEGIQTDLMSTDIYYTTVVDVLKGDMQIGDLVRVVFFANTVFPGERHIISITPVSPTSRYFYDFTSRNSLHGMDQLDEIREILGKPPQDSIFAVSSHDELRNAIQYHIDQGITEQTTITMTQDFTATGATIYVPVGVDIILTSTPGTVFTYTRTTAGRHFVVENGTLTLKDVIICGGTGTHARGGIEVRGTRILNNHAVHDGGGIFTELGSIYQNPMPINAYENIAMMPTTQFLGNTAGNGAVSPPSNAAAVMQRSASVSVFDHQINNYDINFGLEGARTASVFSLDMVEAIDFEYIYEYFSGNRQHVDAQFDSDYFVYITE